MSNITNMRSKNMNNKQYLADTRHVRKHTGKDKGNRIVWHQYWCECKFMDTLNPLL